MIVFLREKFIAQIFMWIIAVVFIIGTLFLIDFGTRGNPFEKEGGKVVLEINGRKVNQREFESLVSNELQRQQYQTQGRTEVDREAVEEQIIDQLINQQVVVSSIKISDAEVEHYIRADENLRSGYNFYMMQQGNADAYLHYVRLLMSDEVLRNQIQGLPLATDLEVEREYYRQNRKAKFKFIQFQHYEYTSAVKVDDAEVEAYFNQHRDKYKLGDQINLQFIKLDPRNFVTDADVQAYYNENRREYVTPEVVKARHILKKFPDDATDEQKAEVKAEAEKLLETVKQEIADGKSFAELATAHSDDTGSAPNGGALRGSNRNLPPGDYFARGDMVKPFEETAFDKLKPGEISDLVETVYGYHILQLEEKRPEEPKPFAEVTTQIRNKLVQIIGTDKAKTLADDLLFDVEIQDYTEAIALERYKDFSLTVDETGFFEENVISIPKIGYIGTFSGLLEKAFDMEVGVSTVIETKRQYSGGEVEAYFVARALEKKPATAPDFQTVKAKVVDDYKNEKAKSLALEDAQNLLNKRSEGESLDDLAKKYTPPEGVSQTERQAKESKPFARSPTSNYVLEMGTSREAMFAAFEMELNEVRRPIQGDDGAVYIVQLVERQEPDMEAFKNDAAEQAKIRRSLLQTKKNEVYSNWLASLKKQAKVVDKRSAS